MAGINAGDGRFESIDLVNNISNTTNVNIPGVWMYQTNERTVIYPSKKLSLFTLPAVNFYFYTDLLVAELLWITLIYTLIHLKCET